MNPTSERRRRAPRTLVAARTKISPASRAALALFGAAVASAAIALSFASSFGAPLPSSGNADRLGLTRYTLQRLQASRAGAATRWSLTLGGSRVTLRLEPRSLRAAGFRVLEQRADGTLVETVAPPSLTQRGTVEEWPGSIVGATARGDRLDAVVALPDGRLFYVQPTGADGDLAGTTHVVYAADSAAAVEGACATDEPSVSVEPRDLESSLGTLAGPLVTELAIDADYELFVKNGSSTSATVQDVESVMSAVNVIYERDCQITHRLVTVIVRSSEVDPYTSTSASTLLSELRNHWNGQHGGIRRDLVHLMTGKDLDGSTIGIASVGVVCNTSYGYGLSQTRFSSTSSRRAALTAHELGHNWNASHCDAAAECHVMCSSIGGCEGLGLPNLEPTSIDAIRGYAASRSCLDTPLMAVGDAAASGAIRLSPARPSPFTRSTSLGYFLAEEGAVRLAIYDIAGKRILTLADGRESAGWHTRQWDGLDAGGTPVRAGVYYARLEAGAGARTQKMILVR